MNTIWHYFFSISILSSITFMWALKEVNILPQGIAHQEKPEPQKSRIQRAKEKIEDKVKRNIEKILPPPR